MYDDHNGIVVVKNIRGGGQVVSLVEENARRGTRKLRELSSIEELSKHPPNIPWLKKVEKVKVKET